VASQDDVWLEQVPPSLRRAHFAARWALKWLERTYAAVYRVYEFPVPDPEDGLSPEQLANLEARRSRCHNRCAKLILAGRARLSRAERCIARVAGEFAAVGCPDQWELHRRTKNIGSYEGVCYGMVLGRSEHDFAGGIASCWLGECERAIAATKRGVCWLSGVSEDDVSQLDERDIKSYVKGVGLAVEQCEEPPTDDIGRRLRQLTRELRRAHKRRSILKVRFACDLRHKRKERPTYLRDHAWLDWANGEKLGPAAIRDRWNDLPQEERERICPRAPGRIGKGETARDLVKKALNRAKCEQATDRKRK
jgi:hypothetical protein